MTDVQVAYAVIATACTYHPFSSTRSFHGIVTLVELDARGALPAGNVMRLEERKLYVGLYGTQDSNELDLYAISPSGSRRHVARESVDFAPGSLATTVFPVEITPGDWGSYGMELSIRGRVLTTVPLHAIPR